MAISYQGYEKVYTTPKPKIWANNIVWELYFRVLNFPLNLYILSSSGCSSKWNYLSELFFVRPIKHHDILPTCKPYLVDILCFVYVYVKHNDWYVHALLPKKADSSIFHQRLAAVAIDLGHDSAALLRSATTGEGALLREGFLIRRWCHHPGYM